MKSILCGGESLQFLLAVERFEQGTPAIRKPVRSLIAEAYFRLRYLLFQLFRCQPCHWEILRSVC